MRYVSLIVVFAVGMFLSVTMTVFFEDAAMTSTANWRVVAKYLPAQKDVQTADAAASFCNALGAHATSAVAVNPAVLNSTSSKKSGNPLIDFLDTVGASSSFESRAKLASGIGIRSYKGSASQDAAILGSLKAIPDFWGGADVSQIPAPTDQQSACSFGKDLLSSLNP